MLSTPTKPVRPDLTAAAIDELQRAVIERYNTTEMSYTELLNELGVLKALRAELLQTAAPRSTTSVYSGR